MMDRERYPSRAREQLPLVARVEPTVWSRHAPGPLSKDELAIYDARGYLVLPELVDRRTAETLRLEADVVRGCRRDETTIHEPGGGAVRSAFALHRDGGRFEALAADPAITSAARQILGEAVYVHQSRINYKPAFNGEGFAWHSDFETWHHEDGMPEMRALSVVVFLSHNRAFNGPVLVIPGSHRTFVPCVGETPPEHHVMSLVRQEFGVPSETAVSALASSLGLDVITGAPGTVVIFDANLLHASGNNPSPFDRTNFFLVYNAVSNAPRTRGAMQRPEFLASRGRTS